MQNLHQPYGDVYPRGGSVQHAVEARFASLRGLLSALQAVKVGPMSMLTGPVAPVLASCTTFYAFYTLYTGRRLTMTAIRVGRRRTPDLRDRVQL